MAVQRKAWALLARSRRIQPNLTDPGPAGTFAFVVICRALTQRQLNRSFLSSLLRRRKYKRNVDKIKLWKSGRWSECSMQPTGHNELWLGLHRPSTSLSTFISPYIFLCLLSSFVVFVLMGGRTAWCLGVLIDTSSFLGNPQPHFAPSPASCTTGIAVLAAPIRWEAGSSKGQHSWDRKSRILLREEKVNEGRETP